MRTTREWQFLQALKRAGNTHPTTSNNHAGDLAIRCPACPIPGFNCQPSDIGPGNSHLFTRHVSFDGSFQLGRRNKAYDSWDLCLTDARMYFVGSKPYLEFLERVKRLGHRLTTRDADCNNHKAADTTWTKFTGVDETGLGCVVCARHSFFMPLGTVNFFEGERYAYADYAFASVLLRALLEGINSCGIHYDIMCHYLKNLWQRWASLNAPLSPLTPDLFVTFITAIPKFHLAGHTDGCWARFSLNHMFGVGRLDAEGGERCWSNLNHAAGSTLEKGPGSRVDSLNHVMHQWNWCKTVEMADFILRKWKEAVDMSHQQQAAWQEFSSTLDASKVSAWELLDIKPSYDQATKQWVSVFALPDPPAMSITATLKKLTAREQAAASAPSTHIPAVGAALWIATAMEITVSQHRLHCDVKAWGENPTPRQALEIATRRKSLLAQVQESHKSSALFLPIPIPVDNTPLQADDQGKPELL
ncbi:hypothetical protein FRC08_014472, partial [Ceratobasidium sp. 394]